MLQPRRQAKVPVLATAPGEVDLKEGPAQVLALAMARLTQETPARVG